jgi:hypothetical protein
MLAANEGNADAMVLWMLVLWMLVLWMLVLWMLVQWCCGCCVQWEAAGRCWLRLHCPTIQGDGTVEGDRRGGAARCGKRVMAKAQYKW